MLNCPKCEHEAMVAEFEPLEVKIPDEPVHCLTYECPNCKWVGTETDVNIRPLDY